MPLTPNFTAVQLFGSPNEIVLTDTSIDTTGISSRRVFIQMPNGTYLVEEGTTTDYEVWAIADDSITLDVLTKDVAVTITVQWLIAGGAIEGTKVYEFGFTQFNETFDYGLTQMLTANPLLINDNNFFPNKSELRVCIDSGNQALSLVGDLFAAQQCYDRATGFRLDSRYLFNINS
jgi:hypothetical protein